MLHCGGMCCPLPQGVPAGGLWGPGAAGHGPAGCSPTQRKGWGGSAWVMPPPLVALGHQCPLQGSSPGPSSALGFRRAAAGQGSLGRCSGDGEEATGSGGSALRETPSRQHCLAQQHPSESQSAPGPGRGGWWTSLTLRPPAQCEPWGALSVLWMLLGDPGTGVACGGEWLWGFWGLQELMTLWSL